MPSHSSSPSQQALTPKELQAIAIIAKHVIGAMLGQNLPFSPTEQQFGFTTLDKNILNQIAAMLNQNPTLFPAGIRTIGSNLDVEKYLQLVFVKTFRPKNHNNWQFIAERYMSIRQQSGNSVSPQFFYPLLQTLFPRIQELLLNMNQEIKHETFTQAKLLREAAWPLEAVSMTVLNKLRANKEYATVEQGYNSALLPSDFRDFWESLRDKYINYTITSPTNYSIDRFLEENYLRNNTFKTKLFTYAAALNLKVNGNQAVEQNTDHRQPEEQNAFINQQSQQDDLKQDISDDNTELKMDTEEKISVKSNVNSAPYVDLDNLEAYDVLSKIRNRLRQIRTQSNNKQTLEHYIHKIKLSLLSKLSKQYHLSEKSNALIQDVEDFLSVITAPSQAILHWWKLKLDKPDGKKAVISYYTNLKNGMSPDEAIEKSVYNLIEEKIDSTLCSLYQVKFNTFGPGQALFEPLNEQNFITYLLEYFRVRYQQPWVEDNKINQDTRRQLTTKLGKETRNLPAQVRDEFLSKHWIEHEDLNPNKINRQVLSNLYHSYKHYFSQGKTNLHAIRFIMRNYLNTQARQKSETALTEYKRNHYTQKHDTQQNYVSAYPKQHNFLSSPPAAAVNQLSSDQHSQQDDLKYSSSDDEVELKMDTEENITVKSNVNSNPYLGLSNREVQGILKKLRNKLQQIRTRSDKKQTLEHHLNKIKLSLLSKLSKQYHLSEKSNDLTRDIEDFLGILTNSSIAVRTWWHLALSHNVVKNAVTFYYTNLKNGMSPDEALEKSVYSLIEEKIERGVCARYKVKFDILGPRQALFEPLDEQSFITYLLECFRFRYQNPTLWAEDNKINLYVSRHLKKELEKKTQDLTPQVRDELLGKTWIEHEDLNPNKINRQVLSNFYHFYKNYSSQGNTNLDSLRSTMMNYLSNQAIHKSKAAIKKYKRKHPPQQHEVSASVNQNNFWSNYPAAAANQQQQAEEMPSVNSANPVQAKTNVSSLTR